MVIGSEVSMSEGLEGDRECACARPDGVVGFFDGWGVVPSWLRTRNRRYVGFGCSIEREKLTISRDNDEMTTDVPVFRTGLSSFRRRVLRRILFLLE
jgi:hypothetical protein